MPHLLLETGYSAFYTDNGDPRPYGVLTDFIPVTEQSTGAGVPNANFIYRGFNPAPSPIPGDDSLTPGDFSQTNVQVLSADAAVSTTHGTYRNFNSSGTPTKAVPFVFTAVWRREGTDWRIVDAHESVRSDWPSAQ